MMGHTGIPGSTIKDVDGKKRPSFNVVERELRKRTFGVISTVDHSNRPHSTGVLFGMSAPGDPVYFYIVTRRRTVKVRNIRRNPRVSLLVSFPHYFLRVVPDSTVTIRGQAELLSLDDKGFKSAFESKRMLRMILRNEAETMGEAVVIRIVPEKTIRCYGLGIPINELIKNPTEANYNVIISTGRLKASANNTKENSSRL